MWTERSLTYGFYEIALGEYGAFKTGLAGG